MVDGACHDGWGMLGLTKLTMVDDSFHHPGRGKKRCLDNLRWSTNSPHLNKAVFTVNEGDCHGLDNLRWSTNFIHLMGMGLAMREGLSIL